MTRSLVTGPRGRARGRLAVLATLVAVLAVSACDGAPSTEDAGGDGGSSSGEQDAGSASSQAVPGPLEDFYSQEISWSDCEGGECGRLQVPIDYENPGQGSIELAVIRVPAEDSDAR
ncbi:MAG TPA: hypothetical protein VJ976_08400, partial [Ornithinimicrobium sp.]|nr:hypothetical protein [Ornithinimicrobium sp.]